MDKNPLLFESVRTLFRSVSEHSYKLLAKDITNGSREKRRERSCRKAGVVLAATKVSGTQEAQRAMLEGILSRGQKTNYSVEGKDFAIDGSTWIIGELKLGTLCSVAIHERSENEIFAVKIVMK